MVFAGLTVPFVFVQMYDRSIFEFLRDSRREDEWLSGSLVELVGHLVLSGSLVELVGHLVLRLLRLGAGG